MCTYFSKIKILFENIFLQEHSKDTGADICYIKQDIQIERIRVTSKHLKL